ncbi:hypothetical protein [Thiococcus pfennigii]|jgi:hypothetical protein|uniref:hypothetical protein n=1 Tax=Thiococcus pfennigii TaxID=1057 RepID=UPI0019066AD1|nr:hypothetical protein [Thiococcus pfennigii]MBK1702651.1 hypothetical protein [Thiococcus pfennigii]MBK1731203.1 hypothetical protein [Thiococcus pfennigii]
MEGSIIAKLVFALVATLAVMGASWGLQRLSVFQQIKPLARILSMAATIFAAMFLLQLIWP